MESVTRDVQNLAREFSQFFSGSKILVTGGAGFLGSWLCDVLVESGSIVDCLDNFSTATRENIKHLTSRIKVIQTNIEDANLTDAYEYIFNFSSRASPDEYVQHPIDTLTANSIGTMRMLELAKRNKSTLIHASTSEIYGDAQVVPTPESYYGYANTIGIRSCYDEGKRYAESLCMAYFREDKVDVKLPRIFNSYGPRIRGDGLYGRALSRFIVQALDSKPITIYGDGKQTRSFCYVTDTIRGILKLACVPDGGLVINIGNPNEITVLDLAKRIVDCTKSSSALSFSPMMQDDPKRRCPDITNASKVLGWSPQIELGEGLQRTVEWFRSHHPK